MIRKMIDYSAGWQIKMVLTAFVNGYNTGGAVRVISLVIMYVMAAVYQYRRAAHPV